MITLRELINKKQPEGFLDMTPHRDLFGEDLPEVPLNNIGKFRLMSLLRMRFGANYKSFSKSKEIMDSFDNESKMHLMKLKMQKRM